MAGPANLHGGTGLESTMQKATKAGAALVAIAVEGNATGDPTPLSMTHKKSEAMSTIVYVVGFKPDERVWIESALGRSIESVVFLDDGEALFASEASNPGHCVIASADADASATLKLVRELRDRRVTLPVIVLGPYTAFRTAIDIARLKATDFLERPVSVRQLRAAVHRACTDSR
ncbi:hypothetical protein WKW80_29465 [Variovorax humicola]|uniref:Response regulatory domain-containing protein n=1 Tax=Variovorax humicola TaxID=1769758 RepID=A0ABU8W7T2_9BURK